MTCTRRAGWSEASGLYGSSACVSRQTMIANSTTITTGPAQEAISKGP